MPRNRFGGKNAKKMGNKHTNAQENESFKLLLPEEEDQFFAVVTKRCGDGRFTVEYMDNDKKTEGMGKVPGSMRKITRNIKEGSVVVFQVWGLSESSNKGSILHVYSEYETNIFKDRGYLYGLIDEVTAPNDIAVDGNVENEEEEVDIDAL